MSALLRLRLRAGTTHDAFLDAVMLASQHRLGQSVTVPVRIMAQAVKISRDAQPRRATKIIDQIEQLALLVSGARA